MTSPDGTRLHMGCGESLQGRWWCLLAASHARSPRPDKGHDRARALRRHRHGRPA